jgi:urea transport system permease protein
MDTILNQTFIGVSQGSILLLVALGLVFTFGQMGVINMAHGELIMAGAYTPYVLQTQVGLFAGLGGVAFVAAIPVAFVVAGAIGLLIERLLLRRMYSRPLDTLLVTFGVSLVLQQFAKDRFGAQPVEVRAPTWLSGNFEVAGVSMTYTRLFIIGLCAAVVAGVWWFMYRLPQGHRMRAVVQNRQLASVSGLPTGRVDALTFFIGSGLAGIAGVAVSLVGSVAFTTGASYIVDSFLVVIVGGLGKLRGAFIAAFAIGLSNSFLEYGTSATLGKALVFALVIIFLQARPNGLVTLRTRGLTG